MRDTCVYTTSLSWHLTLPTHRIFSVYSAKVTAFVVWIRVHGGCSKGGGGGGVVLLLQKTYTLFSIYLCYTRTIESCCTWLTLDFWQENKTSVACIVGSGLNFIFHFPYAYISCIVGFLMLIFHDKHPHIYIYVSTWTTIPQGPKEGVHLTSPTPHKSDGS